MSPPNTDSKEFLDTSIDDNFFYTKEDFDNKIKNIMVINSNDSNEEKICNAGTEDCPGNVPPQLQQMTQVQ